LLIKETGGDGVSAFVDSGHDRGWWVLAALSYLETFASPEFQARKSLHTAGYALDLVF